MILGNRQNLQQINNVENQANHYDQQHKEYFEKQNFDNQKLLNMINKNVSDQSFQVFAQNCHRFPRLQKIQFSLNFIKDEGFKKLAENSHHLKHLVRLNLTSNRIHLGLKYFCEISCPLLNLQEMYFYNNKIDDSGLIALAQNGEKYPKLKYLDLGLNRITDEGVIKFVQNVHKFSEFENLTLGWNQITDRGLRAVFENSEKFSELKKLELQQNKIEGLGFRGMEVKFDSLEKILLRNNQISDSGLKGLVSTGLFQNLVQINVEGNKITDASVKILMENGCFPRCKAIYLNESSLCYQSLFCLIKNKPNMPELESFMMMNCKTTVNTGRRWQTFLKQKGLLKDIYF